LEKLLKAPDKEKNELLKLVRGVSFEEVVKSWESGGLLVSFNHPNAKKYPNQKMAVVVIKDYVYLVPYVEDEEKFFLKTIYPSRNATRKYLKK
jgi:hypothetical protein